ncbi:MAG: MarR family transcriptional regulator [Bacteroidetes bacterium]|jgi:DNA-binding MarR family transcriptional regulator|nr:MarR family transcriptional regulator [Bacteroidota bacterium]
MMSDEILRAIRRILRAVNLESKRCQKEYGLSMPQLLVLSFIAQEPEMRATNKAIKAHMQLNASTVTGIMQRLLAKGYVARVPNADDQRGSLVALTQSGYDLINSTPPPLQLKLERGIEKLSESDRKKLKKYFEFIVQLLELGEDDAAPIFTGDLLEE